jgi:hypothetical protein
MSATFPPTEYGGSSILPSSICPYFSLSGVALPTLVLEAQEGEEDPLQRTASCATLEKPMRIETPYL